MTNIVPIVITMLVALCEKLINGAVKYGAAIGLLHNTGPTIRADVDPLIEANNNCEQAKVSLSAKRGIVRSVMDTARDRLTLGRDMLKRILGSEYSQAWDILTFA